MSTINTRIVLKHGELATAESSTTTLHEGEIVLAKTTDGHYVAKVGEEGKTYTESKHLYSHAKATDVDYGDSSNVETALNTINTTLNTLTGGSADGSIQKLIEDEINELNYVHEPVDSQVVTSVSQLNGVIAVTSRTLGLTDVDGLPPVVTQVNTNATNITEIQGDVTDIKSRLGTLEGYKYVAGVGTQEQFEAFVPETELIAGAIYIVTDNVDKVWDGTNWQDLTNEYAWTEINTKVESNATDINTLEETTVRVKSNKLVCGTEDKEIIIDCGSF